jgi:predicted nucleotide-binding protein
VFVVHGHDEAARELTARFLEKLGTQPIILHEQPNEGRTIIEKLEHNAQVAFAVVLLTPDDVGAVATTADRLNQRARQNVILELGYFVGKLGRNRVCALHKGSIALPSDILGVAYVPMDESGGWKLLLAKELRAAGFDVDLNRAI